jgi:hypothetical protein
VEVPFASATTGLKLISLMASSDTDPSIEEYLRERLMPVEGAIPHLLGIDIHGNSIPAGTVGGDLLSISTSSSVTISMHAFSGR